ncbi:MAG TPA: crossover junction endodeoxyribonuclease RuvC [Candidatus Paceibacterota bacterium]|nr:crossover junction endodeoxyribonuclease RuvC [Candidatus Paceibacterota bacterium]
MKILAVDPGYERLGVAIIKKNPGEKERVIYSNCFKTSAKQPFEERLLLIGQEIKRLIKEFEPAALAIETLYFTNNQKTAMHVSEVRGVVTYEALCASMKLFEYTPLQIKVAVTGYGGGDKKQVISMIEKLVTIDKNIAHDDEYDAIAVGLTYFATARL